MAFGVTLKILAKIILNTYTWLTIYQNKPQQFCLILFSKTDYFWSTYHYILQNQYYIHDYRYWIILGRFHLPCTYQDITYYRINIAYMIKVVNITHMKYITYMIKLLNKIIIRSSIETVQRLTGVDNKCLDNNKLKTYKCLGNSSSYM